MKFQVVLFSVAFVLAQSLQVLAQGADPVKTAKAINEKKVDKGVVNAESSDFLIKSADARMMGADEGKLAIKKGTTPAIRAYGKLMVDEQRQLLTEIKRVAKKTAISLPSDISSKKQDGREDLAAESGAAFDQKFIRMMIIDHERDIKLFKKAAESEDADVAEFATKYLPMIESHLAKIEAIKDDAR